MLNGIDPIILFNFKILPPSVKTALTKVPLIADIVSAIDLPVVPIYLSEKLTGIYIDSESKNIEVATDTDTLSDGTEPITSQRGISSTVRIEMIAKRDSIGLMILSTMGDLIFPKVTSKEYSITYLHGSVTVFAGLLHSFSISQNSTNDLFNISLELIKPSSVAKVAKKGSLSLEPVKGVDLNAKPVGGT